MIGSILNIWCGTPSAPPTTLDHPTGLTRAGLLRLGAAGLVAAGIGPIAGEALATGRRRIAPVLEIDRVYDVWQQRFNAADLAGIVDLYVADVTYINPEERLCPASPGSAPISPPPSPRSRRSTSMIAATFSMATSR